MIADLVFSWRALAIFLVCYSAAPYALLWVIVRCWPKDHPRRQEFLAEYDAVPTHRRPDWVVDVAVRSLLDGTAERCRRAEFSIRWDWVAMASPSIILAVYGALTGDARLVLFTISFSAAGYGSGYLEVWLWHRSLQRVARAAQDVIQDADLIEAIRFAELYVSLSCEAPDRISKRQLVYDLKSLISWGAGSHRRDLENRVGEE